MPSSAALDIVFFEVQPMPFRIKRENQFKTIPSHAWCPFYFYILGFNDLKRSKTRISPKVTTFQQPIRFILLLRLFQPRLLPLLICHGPKSSPPMHQSPVVPDDGLSFFGSKPHFVRLFFEEIREPFESRDRILLGSRGQEVACS
jgi:hypothetical protein